MWNRRAWMFLGGAIALTGCAGAPPTDLPRIQAPAIHRTAAALPNEILYVAGGARTSRKPFIEVFDGADTSASPVPLYTIPPQGGGAFGPLAVDGNNTLYALSLFPSGAKIEVFPSGATRASKSCRLFYLPQRIAERNGVLYVTAPQYTIDEYTLPLASGPDCPQPARVLTDRYALLRGAPIGLIGVAVDAKGNVYDSWETNGARSAARIDWFQNGSSNAHLFAIAGVPLTSFDMTSDASGRLITNVSDYDGRKTDDIAVFPRALHRPHLSHPIGDGQYLGVALAKHDTELFQATDHPSTHVDVYAYDPATGVVGTLLRSFTRVWVQAQPIAVYSRSQ